MIIIFFLLILKFYAILKKIITLNITIQAAEQILLSYPDIPKQIKLITSCKENHLKRLNIATSLIRDEGKTYFYKVF